ncbi:MAG: type IV secretion system protein [Mesorhizobium sp.]|uniref:type IV secretion system protein n=2 Tax=unclassified Mesorhizobium TaxID=325217 RepID=UPI000FE7CF4A|nr:type IV secretion system protein [Mesorhizobium sp.]RWA88144.1 MAG: type IV secretion system protein [Mesorhizobium sp.]TIU31089.1 MAG: type IV secretion system protein [Mesorhizobium sp.]
MEDFIGELLQRIDASGQNFSQRAYEALSADLEPLLRLLFVLVVLFYGTQLFLGTSRLSVAEIVGRLARVIIIFILVGTWSNFDALVYDWLTKVPEAAGRAVLSASGTGVTEPTNGLSQIWKTANVAASTFSEQAGYFSVLPALIGMVIMVFAGLFVAIALGILVLAKVILWVLLGTAPIFISCMLFNPTRNYAIGWLNQSLLYALIPLFVYVIAAFLIAAMAPELTKINQISGNRELKLSDFAAFIMLCLAGSFVLIQIQSLAQGIVGGLATPIGQRSRSFTDRGIMFGRMAIGTSSRQMQAAVHRVQAQLHPPRNMAREAMQRAITANGTPG